VALVPVPEEVGGYVLAGGKSLRMGQDKALLKLAGKPLVRHAVKKLRRVCMDVRILSDNPALEEYAPIVPDMHPGCGPMGGMEAALAHSVFEWNLFLPVDMPFLPSAFVQASLSLWIHAPPTKGARIRMFSVDGRPQPGFCLLHKDVKPFLTKALENGEFKLMPLFQKAGTELALRQGLLPEEGLWNVPMTGFRVTPGPKRLKADWCYTTEAQQRAEHLWFANLNTPEDFSEAKRHIAALDT
jgi:molybdenum cofactor guanylyltransferase